MIDAAWLTSWAALEWAVALAAVGVISGTVAGLLGVGGGIVIVPVLYYVLDAFGIDPSVRMHVAVGTSLATIIPTSIVSARGHHRRGAVDPELLRAWGPAILAGVLIGTALAGIVRGQVLTAVFASVAILVAIRMGFARKNVTIAGTLPVGLARHSIGAIIGLFSAMMGIGGGTLSVPILSAFGYPIRRAVGTASAIGLIVAVPGTVGFVLSGLGEPGRPPYCLGYVSLIGFVLLVPASMLSTPWGVRLAHRIETRSLELAFAVFLAITSARMFYSLL